jgi:hypothetical protein
MTFRDLDDICGANGPVEPHGVRPRPPGAPPSRAEARGDVVRVDVDREGPDRRDAVGRRVPGVVAEHDVGAGRGLRIELADVRCRGGVGVEVDRVDERAQARQQEPGVDGGEQDGQIGSQTPDRERAADPPADAHDRSPGPRSVHRQHSTFGSVLARGHRARSPQLPCDGSRGRLAQLAEHFPYKEGVAGSSPAPPIENRSPCREVVSGRLAVPSDPRWGLLDDRSVRGSVYEIGGRSASGSSTRETLRIQAEAAGRCRPRTIAASRSRLAVGASTTIRARSRRSPGTS